MGNFISAYQFMVMQV